MKNFFEWFNENNSNLSSWLVLGKGPSFSKISDFDISSFNIISLNHIVRHVKVKIAHAIDWEVAVDCAKEINCNAEYLLLPSKPNTGNLPGSKDLSQLISENPFLKKLSEENRLLWYDLKLVSFSSQEWKSLITEKKKNGNYPIVPATYFSVEAVINLLAMSGVKHIKTLGIDGGNSYSNVFNDIKDKTLLANGQKSFNIQFLSLSKTVMEKSITYSPLGVEESPIKIFVGSMPEQMLAVKVLDYSIKKHCSMSVDVFPLFKSEIKVPLPRDPKNKPRTPFSFQRFMIPELKKHKGRAIYLDSDMQVFKDIKDLWTRPFNNFEILSAFETSDTGRKPQFAVMLLNCEELKWNVTDIVAKLDKNELSYEQLMYEMGVTKKISPNIEREWNSLEYFEEGKTSLLHYTDMNSQPWLFTHNSNMHVWVRELKEAIENGFIEFNYVIDQVEAGLIRPSIIYQLKKNKFNLKNIPSWILIFDKWFIPPHRQSQVQSKFKRWANRNASKILIYLYK